jgi:hypothetical protein
MCEQVRELHGDERGLRCLGCDMEGYEAEAPEWPCRTATLVYSADEITEITETYKLWARWVNGARLRRNLASGWNCWDDVRVALMREFRRQLVADRLFGVS